MKLKQITITVKDDATPEQIDNAVAMMTNIIALYDLNAVIIYSEEDMETEQPVRDEVSDEQQA